MRKASVVISLQKCSHNSRGTDWRVKRRCFHKKFLLVGFCRGMQQLARDGYNFYYLTRDQMNSHRFSGVCSKNATAMPPPLCIRSRRHLFRWTPSCMVLANSTNFIEDMSWVHYRSKPLMTTTTTDMFLFTKPRHKGILAWLARVRSVQPGQMDDARTIKCIWR